MLPVDGVRAEGLTLSGSGVSRLAIFEKQKDLLEGRLAKQYSGSERLRPKTERDEDDALLDAIGKLGAPTFAEVLAEMGVRADLASNARAAVRRKLSMLVQVGAVAFTPSNPSNPRAGGRYTATGRPPIAADLIERFERAPDTFATADLGLPPGRAAAGAIRSLIAAGLVESVGRAAVWRKTSTARRAA
jgi:hypothetical protein